MPTLALPPAELGAFRANDPNGPAVDFAAMSAFMPYTPLATMTGLPAVTVPLHWNTEGLPIGVMAVGRYGDEVTVISLAVQLEEAAAVRDRHPAVW
jgi:amidase